MEELGNMSKNTSRGIILGIKTHMEDLLSYFILSWLN